MFTQHSKEKLLINMIEKKIGYFFKNKALLDNALTHPSYKTSYFQSLEFLGDRVLGLIASEMIFSSQVCIKTLAQEFSNLVSTNALVKIADFWEVDKYFKHKIQCLSSKVLADIVEAIIAAIYLDSDLKTIKRILCSLYEKKVSISQKAIEPKMRLQELSQAKLLGLPVYTLEKEEEHNNVKQYTIKVEVSTLGIAFGVASSKHQASKIAAQNLLDKINQP